jgi:hypothetical protein
MKAASFGAVPVPQKAPEAAPSLSIATRGMLASVTAAGRLSCLRERHN